MASSSESEKEWRAPDKKEDQPKGSGSVATGSEKGAQGSRVETAGSAPEGSGVPLQPPPPQEPKTPPQEPEEEYVEVTVEVEPTPPKAAPKGRGSPVGKGHLKGSIGKQSVGRVKGKGSGPKAAESGKLDSNMPKIKAQPKPPQVKAAPKRPSAPASSSKGPGTKAGAVNLVPKGVRKVHLKPRPDSLKSNPPLGRRWSAYPRKRKGKQQKAKTETKSTQTPEIMTVMGHAERHEKLEEEAKAFAQLLERHSSPNQYEARFPQVDLSIAAGRAEVTTRAVVVITDKTSYTSPMPTHRQHPPPPPPPTGSTGEHGGTAAPESPGSYSMVTGPEAPRTPDAGTAALETPAPSTPPRTTLNVSKKAKISEEQQEKARGSQDQAVPCQ